MKNKESGNLGWMTIFKNRFGSVRSGWKIVFMLTLFLSSSWFFNAVQLWSIFRLVGVTWQVADNIENLMMVLCEIGSVLFMVYLIERARLRDFGLPFPRQKWRQVSYGLAWGAGSQVLIFMILRWTGNIELKYPLMHPQWNASLLFLLILMFGVGFGEELMNRGYALTIILRQTGRPWLAVIVSSVLFSAQHAFNPGYSLYPALNIVLYAVLASIMYLRTGSLWMAIAYHASWDFFEGNVFGFPDSGNTAPSLFPVLHIRDNLLTGGLFGPEGGVLVTIVQVLALIWIWKGYRPGNKGLSPTTY